MNTTGTALASGKLKVKVNRTWPSRIAYWRTKLQKYLGYVLDFPNRVEFLLKNLGAILRNEIIVGKAELSAVKITADGNVVDYGVVSRKKVTQAFVLNIVDAMCDSAGTGQLATFNDYQYHDCGTGGDQSTESNSSTTLTTGGAGTGGTRVIGAPTDVSTSSTGKMQTQATIPFDATKAIREHAVFNAASSGTMLDRSAFSDITVNNGDSIQFTYVLSIDAES